MNTRTVVAALSTGVFYFLAGWLVYGMLLHDMYTANMIHYDGLAKPEGAGSLLAILASNLILGTLVTLVAVRSGHGNMLGGMLTGLWVGLLLLLYMDTNYYAFFNLYNTKILIVEVVVGTLFIGCGGAVSGLILGSGKKE